jgi:hypothetical protein
MRAARDKMPDKPAQEDAEDEGGAGGEDQQHPRSRRHEIRTAP